MQNQYATEKEGQLDFYKDYLQLVDSSLSIDDILSDSNDGVLRGNIIEFKLNISDLNAVLFQAIKYLSARRIKGKPVPANIVLVSLNHGKTYCYHSEDYLHEIEQVYTGGASRANTGFQGRKPSLTLDYRDNSVHEAELIKILRSDEHTEIHIDENNVVGWATSYYKLCPNARKSDFIGDLTSKVKLVGEIRKPVVFEKYIHPYHGETNVKFQYLMDRLNDDIQKKNLGAFYTPLLYAEKSLELVRKAIERVPEGNDYVILDRCAGTGNLEKLMTDEELSHCILSTYEYYEYKVLLELLGDKVRHIVPPTEKEDTFNMGLVKGADAMSEEYVNNPVVMQYVNDPKVTIIMYENPPYAEVNGTTRKENQSALWKKNYVVQEMKKEVNGTALNDLGNAFIWSAFKYYLRQPTDSYIVYSPIKYWKAQHLIHKKMIMGFAFNRKHFHATTPACIVCAMWSQEESRKDSFSVEAYNIIESSLVDESLIRINKIHSPLSKMYDKRRFVEDVETGICVDLNGTERCLTKSNHVKKIFNNNIVGYLVANGSGFDNPRLNSALTISGRYDGHGFYIRKDNYLEKLPLFSAGKYTDNCNDWKIMSQIMKSADKKDKYLKAVGSGELSAWLLKVLLWTSLTQQAHMRSFTGSNGIYYRNELCLDDSSGETLATAELRRMSPNDNDAKLFNQWNTIIECAKETGGYNPELTYGVYQIQEELNTFKTVKEGKQNKRVYDYPELNGNLSTLKAMLKDYYLDVIVPVLFEYEFLK